MSRTPPFPPYLVAYAATNPTKGTDALSRYLSVYANYSYESINSPRCGCFSNSSRDCRVPTAARGFKMPLCEFSFRQWAVRALNSSKGCRLPA